MLVEKDQTFCIGEHVVLGILNVKPIWVRTDPMKPRQGRVAEKSMGWSLS